MDTPRFPLGLAMTVYMGRMVIFAKVEAAGVGAAGRIDRR
jgi:hypothetical protein